VLRSIHMCHVFSQTSTRASHVIHMTNVFKIYPPPRGMDVPMTKAQYTDSLIWNYSPQSTTTGIMINRCKNRIR